jgi:hypothetical protein
MPMLNLAGAPFSTGRADFVDEPLPAAGRSARVYVRVAVEGLEEPVLALLDTGAEWPILAREIAEEIGLTDASGEQETLRHANGTSTGRLVRTTMRLLADEGDDLAVETTVFVPDEIAAFRRNFIGYTTFLERIKLGLDPQQNHIYFGGYDGH